MKESESAAVIATLNEILELELAGVVRYSHYSLMIFGHARIPIVSWMRAQATEALAHADAAGEYVTALEPMNGTVDGRANDRARGLLDQIPAGGQKVYKYRIEVVTDRSRIEEFRALNGSEAKRGV